MSVQQTAFIADIGVALSADDALPAILQACAEAVVRHLGAAFARVWTLAPEDDVLALRASAGQYTHLNGPHSRVPVGALKIGLIAAERRPHLTNDVPNDPRVSDPEWAAREGMIAFAGYPLIARERVVGVLALFARHRLGEETLAMLASVAAMIATGIARHHAEERQREETQISDALLRVGTALASERDLHALLQSVTDAATGLVGAQFGSFFYNVTDDSRGSYMLYTISGAPRDAFAAFPMPRNTAIFGPTFAGEGLVRLADVTQDPRYGRSAPYFGMPPGHLPVRSYLAVPVVSHSGAVIGGLFFGHADPDVFTERAELIVVGIAAQAAIATDNAQLLRDAQAAEARFRSLFAQVPDAILVADDAGQYLDANPAATALLGYSHDELLCLSVSDIVAADMAWTQDEYAQFTANGSWRDELDVRRKDGDIVSVEVQATAIALPGRTLYLSVLRDISTRRRYEREQRDFIAMVAHDLKNPLTAIKGYVQLMQRRGSYSAQNVATIAAQANRLERLIDDLRDVVRTDAARIVLAYGETDLTALARAAVEEMQTLNPAHAIRLEAPTDPVVGSWDAGRIEQVIGNLLTNAVKYSPEGGEIVVRIETTSDEARVSVTDQGIGVLPEALPKLFERFYRAPGGMATDRKGLGLGLYISKGIIEGHGGQVTAESTVGTGSTFRFTLPYTHRGDAQTPGVVAISR